jgi:hypothetical protein
MNHESQIETRSREVWIAVFNKLPEELPLDRIAQTYESWLRRNMGGCHIRMNNGTLEIHADRDWKAKFAAVRLKTYVLKMPKAYFTLEKKVQLTQKVNTS